MYIDLDHDQRFLDLHQRILDILENDSRDFSSAPAMEYGVTMIPITGFIKSEFCKTFTEIVGPLAESEITFRYVRIKSGLHLHVDSTGFARFVFPVKGSIGDRKTYFPVLSENQREVVNQHIYNQVIVENKDEFSSVTTLSQIPDVEFTLEGAGVIEYQKACFINSCEPHLVEIKNGGVVDSIQIKFKEMNAEEVCHRFNLKK